MRDNFGKQFTVAHKKMEIKKVKRLKVDFADLKLAGVALLLAALLHNSLGIYKLYNALRGSVPGNRGPCLAVGVLSASANLPQRNAIRAGWGASPEICHLKFFIATSKDWGIVRKVQMEGDQYKDIVLVDVAESYDNITHQTLDIFKILTVDPLVAHVMKVDDDTYVRMGLLSKFLRENQERFKGIDTFAGYLARVSRPIRDVNSKWYMSHSDWPYEYYPIWAHGAGYILSANLARAIGNGAAALSLKGKILHLEDVSTGIWVDYVIKSLHKNVEMIHDTRFNFKWGPCLDTDFISHYASPELQGCLAAKMKCSECTAK